MADFPTLQSPDYGWLAIPMFRTQIIDYGSGVEQRIAQDASPRWKFRLQWTLLSDADKTTLQNFYIARKGSFESFNWTHPTTGTVYVVRFAEDVMNFEYFSYLLWNVQTIELIQVS